MKHWLQILVLVILVVALVVIVRRGIGPPKVGLARFQLPGALEKFQQGGDWHQYDGSSSSPLCYTDSDFGIIVTNMHAFLFTNTISIAGRDYRCVLGYGLDEAFLAITTNRDLLYVRPGKRAELLRE
jgi:hypothetical protein